MIVDICEKDVERAINEEQLSFVYQPKVSLHSGKVYGYEVLTRWDHAKHGYISPEILFNTQLNGCLEQMLDKHILLQLFSEISSVIELGYTFAINCSPRKMYDMHFSKTLLNTASLFGISPTSIVLEITEDEVLDNIALVKPAFDFLRGVGVKVSLDDFGARNSTFKQLLNLRFDEIKVDKFFALNSLQNPNAMAMIETMIMFGQRVGSNVLIEGVENEWIHKLLINKGALQAQGYYYSKPKAFRDAFNEYLG